MQIAYSACAHQKSAYSACAHQPTLGSLQTTTAPTLTHRIRWGVLQSHAIFESWPMCG